MFNIFKNFFDYNSREVNRLTKKVEEINALEDKAKKLKDADFKKETKRLQEKVGGVKENLDSQLP